MLHESHEGKFFLRQVTPQTPPVPGVRRGFDHGRAKHPAESKEVAQHFLRDELGSDSVSKSCVDELVPLVKKLVDDAGRSEKEGTGPVKARIQNAIIRHLFNKQRDYPRGFSLEKESRSLQGALVARVARMPGYAGVCNDLFSRERLNGIESTFAYVLARSLELDERCTQRQAEAAPGSTVYFRICGNDTLDARYAVDCVEIVYETTSSGDMTILECSLVQVKSPGFLNNNDDLERKCGPTHRDHREFVGTLFREPLELVAQPKERAEDGKQLLLDMSVEDLLLPTEDAADMAALHSLIEETAATLDENKKSAYYRRIAERAIELRAAVERDESINNDERRVATAFFTELAAWATGKISTMRGSEKKMVAKQADVLLTLPEKVHSTVYVRERRVSTVDCDTRESERGVPALLYRCGQSGQR